jgi:hypothetical protein
MVCQSFWGEPENYEPCRVLLKNTRSPSVAHLRRALPRACERFGEAKLRGRQKPVKCVLQDDLRRKRLKRLSRDASRMPFLICESRRVSCDQGALPSAARWPCSQPRGRAATLSRSPMANVKGRIATTLAPSWSPLGWAGNQGLMNLFHHPQCDSGFAAIILGSLSEEITLSQSFSIRPHFASRSTRSTPRTCWDGDQCWPDALALRVCTIRRMILWWVNGRAAGLCSIFI